MSFDTSTYRPNLHACKQFFILEPNFGTFEQFKTKVLPPIQISKTPHTFTQT
ncbi:hypothetical protein Syun_004098 [Stephania yunnanensis]|uniref:Uncharacterized protein n=1 Tax=Stephania yunnanensis TaxID=152371 RepID=A0AAP0Q4K5_9MAGN